MKEEIEKAIDQVDESAAECCSQMREKANELCNALESYVRQEPMKSVVIAAGIGIVAGLFLSRR
ncbi:MAG TPA: hypothetical protein VGI75_15230 [Pirellulales bacterium]|jgi:ElaB/YqjD/DUF883 family membrane-anchored ribosome-binding protein